ncbi:hypothetical protein B5F10_09225 [Anaerotruncus colihominis]|uniref:Uncharacterized protein n=1 Tax=Anaerotruncus colihominis TaxID=169435 RepID=A0A1Y4MJV4_9FIRM|nr:hypothetical protein B5F11_10435 [Anaerotruncus colihominis]OUP73873.1 hypothetical protein B5F10_09225 [Anaerotruncus colihominis]
MAFILSPYGQGDARARPAAALMADFIMPRRGHDKINAWHLFYLHMARAMRGHGPLPPCWSILSCRAADMIK